MGTRVEGIPEHVPPDLVCQLDLLTPGSIHGCPYEQVAKLTSGPRVVFNVLTDRYSPGAWVPTRAEEIRSVFQRPEIFSSADMAGFSQMLGGSWPLIPVELDPPEHSKYRTFLNKFFSPKTIGAMEDGVRKRAAGLIDRFASRGECEFVEEFGRPFPVSIFMQLMGLPDEDMAMLNGWEHDLLHSTTIDERLRGLRGFYEYLGALMKERRVRPGEDLASFVASAEVEGKPLNDQEIIGIYYLLVVAGLDTVAAALGLHFRHLAMHQDHQARLRGDVKLIPAAVEELLRRYGTIASFRTVTEDTELAGVELKRGDRVNVLTYLASLDPDEFPNPLEVNFDRDPNRHVAFAYGPHRCIGSHLARRELVIALEEFFKRVPTFRITDDRPIPVETGGVLGISALPLSWG